MQTLAVGASLGSGGPRARKLQRLKSSFRSSSNISRLSTVQLIQQIQVSFEMRLMSFLMARMHMTVKGQVGFAMVLVCEGCHAQNGATHASAGSLVMQVAGGSDRLESIGESLQEVLQDMKNGSGCAAGHHA